VKRRSRARTNLQRLVALIDERGPNDCWPYKGSVGTWGYGSFWLNDHNINASRAAYLLLVGPIGEGLSVLHRCDNRLCCNPTHLFLGTQGDNVRDCAAKGRSRGTYSAGDSHPRHGAILTPELVLNARRRFAAGESQSAIARDMGMNGSTIAGAIRGRSWKHI
jgi:hypothetical protein